jgi:adenylate cyclase
VNFSEYLTGMGRFDEAVAEAKRGLELDPLNVVAGQTLGVRYYYARRCDDAIAEFKKALELDKDTFVAHLGVGQCLFQQGHAAEALPEMEKAVELSGGNSWAQATLGWTYARAGQKDKARRVLAQLVASAKDHYVSPVYPAIVASGLDERDAALAFLEQAYADRSPWMVFLNVEPAFDPLRSDPRFASLLRRVGYQAPTANGAPS